MSWDEAGERKARSISLSTRGQFRDKSVTEALVATFKGTCVWDTLSHRLDSVQSHTPRSTEWNDAVRNLKVYLKEAVRPLLLTRLRFFYMTSPGLKKKIFRTTTRAGGKIEHRINFKKDLMTLTHDKLGRILAQLVRAEDGLKGLDGITLIIEIRRLVEDGNMSTDYVPASVHKSIANLALYAEIWIQCRAYALVCG